MIDTGGTLIKSAEKLREVGAGEIYACATHALFSGGALERIERSPISKIVVTDTIPPRRESSKLETLSTAHVFSEAIRRIHRSESISILFEH